MLLGVIVVAGIVAAIAVPIRVGAQNNKKNSAVQSDLVNAKSAVIAYESDTNSLPGVAPDTTPLTVAGLGVYGFTQSRDTVSIVYSGIPSVTSFCIKGVSLTGKSYYVTDSTGVIAATPVPAGC